MSQSKRRRAHGLWNSPLKAEELADELRFSDVLWGSDGRSLVWREERSDRGVLVYQSADRDLVRDLTKVLSVQARVGYGGGDFTVSHGCAYFVAEGRIFRQDLGGHQAQPITPQWGQCSSPCVSPNGKYVIYVHSSETVDLLALVDSEGMSWPARLSQGHDFYMQPCWHPDSTLIAWIAWDHPNMPWDGCALYLGQLSPGQRLPILASEKILAGDVRGNTAFFQPCFSPDGSYLSYISNESGWSNLCLLELNSGRTETPVVEEGEHGSPAWLQGLRTHAWAPDSQAIYFLRLKDGFTSLMRLDLQGRKVEKILGEVEQYTELRQISCSPRKEEVTLIASSPRIPPRIISVSRRGGLRLYRPSTTKKPDPLYLSLPASIRCRPATTAALDYCYGLLYLPTNPEFQADGLPPVIIRIHGGPTSQYTAGYHPETHFFSSRGFAVLELNYRGSSGYGKNYVDALKGNWGVLDVEDTRAAADYLVSRGVAHPKKLILMGGSAGGYTLLMSLITYPGFFRAGICRYGVSNLVTLAEDTHKFEQHYLNSLVGPLPEQQKLYQQRSPVFSAHKIQDPLAIFQGEDDRVVPQTQSKEIVQSLSERGVPHLYRVYPGEGHGWRKKETIRDYYKTVESFLKEQVL